MNDLYGILRNEMKLKNCNDLCTKCWYKLRKYKEYEGIMYINTEIVWNFTNLRQ